jgi:hypothetical protein
MAFGVLLGVPLEEALLLSLVSAGAGLLPDLDTPTSSATHAAGRLMTVPLAIFRKLMVKHRGVSHTLFAALCTGVLAYVIGSGMSQSVYSRPGWEIPRFIVAMALAILVAKPMLKFAISLRHFFRTLVFFLVGLVAGAATGYLAYSLGTLTIRALVPVLLAALAARSLLTFDVSRQRDDKPGASQAEPKYPILRKRTRGMLQLIAGAGAAYVVYRFGTTPHFDLDIALAVALGFFIHLMGDVFMNGVPLLWPIIPNLDRRVTFSHIETDGTADHVIGWVMLLLLFALLGVLVSGATVFPHLLASLA